MTGWQGLLYHRAARRTIAECSLCHRRFEAGFPPGIRRLNTLFACTVLVLLARPWIFMACGSDSTTAWLATAGFALIVALGWFAVAAIQRCAYESPRRP